MHFVSFFMGQNPAFKLFLIETKHGLTSIGIPIIKIKRSHDLGIIIPGKTVFIGSLYWNVTQKSIA